MKELLISDEFRQYRKAQIDEIVEALRSMLSSNNPDPGELKGAMIITKKLLRLPEKLIQGEKGKELMMAMVEEDMKSFHVRFVRSHIMEE